MKITDEMVERAAHAMCVEGGFDPNERMPNDGPRWKYYADGARAALTAALAVQTQQGVDVKALPLNWTTEKKSGFTIHIGRGLGLKYEACIKAYSPGWVVTLGQSDVIFDGAEADEEDAKAAAQSDYETRIRSALVDVPAVESEPVAWTSVGNTAERSHQRSALRPPSPFPLQRGERDTCRPC